MSEKKNLLIEFTRKLENHVKRLNSCIATKDGDWVVKGFIDIMQNVYTISIDTKVISKIMRLLIFPEICKFANENNLKMILR